MERTVLTIWQLFFLAITAPLLSCLITRIKNFLRMRKGQSIWQPYYNLAKLFTKREVVSGTASWVFRAAPAIVFSSVLCAAYLVCALVFGNPANYLGDFLVLIFILALGRFFLSLAALDTGSAFGGMGSSREMFISSLVEPVFCLVIFAVSLKSGSTVFAAVNSGSGLPASFVIAGIALFLITLAETARLPVDNQETHLELTMVHEAMVLEYSGKSLALIEAASYLKQMLMFLLICRIVLAPAGMPPVGFGAWVLVWQYFLRMIIVAAAVAAVEVSVAKMRLFRVADFLGFAFVLGVIANICAMLGA